MKRRKVNCICRCTPRGGIQSLDPRQLKDIVEKDLDEIYEETRPRIIAREGLRLGSLCERTGHPMLALDVWGGSLQHLLWTDDEKQREYADSYRPFYEPHRVPWRYRISLSEARELALHMDLLYRKLHRQEEACVTQKVYDFYESLFADIYCEWLP